MKYVHNYSTLNQDEVGAMLLSYSRQVASAMVYLSGKGFIHRDLAARNILLSVDGVCKVNMKSKQPLRELTYVETTTRIRMVNTVTGSVMKITVPLPHKKIMP